jgi:energy-coupling factor transport system permease protein
MSHVSADNNNIGIRFSVATKFCVLLCAILSAFTLTSTVATLTFFLFLFLLLMLEGYRRAAVSQSCFFIILFILLQLNSRFNMNGIFFSAFYFHMIWRMIPVFMALQMIMKTPPGEIVAALLKIGIPNKAVLMVAVIFRFAPTVSSEFSAVRESMRCRGLLSIKAIMSSPVATLEHAIVPLLLKSLNVADELSVSAVVRGVEKPGRKSSYYKSEIGLSDAICISTSLIAATVLFLREVPYG